MSVLAVCRIKQGCTSNRDFVASTSDQILFQASRAQCEKLLGYWERLFCHVMQTKSHGRRWKFRIEPLRRKLKDGFNPYLSDSESDEDEEDGNETVDVSEVSGWNNRYVLVSRHVHFRVPS